MLDLLPSPPVGVSETTITITDGFLLLTSKL